MTKAKAKKVILNHIKSMDLPVDAFNSETKITTDQYIECFLKIYDGIWGLRKLNNPDEKFNEWFLIQSLYLFTAGIAYKKYLPK